MSKRGEIRSIEQAKILIDFKNVRYKNITPTDIDSFIEYEDRAYVLGEVKFKDAAIPFGQELAFVRATDDLQKIKPTLLIHCNYQSLNDNGQIDLATCNVVRYRFNGKWKTSSQNITYKQLVDRFLKTFGGLKLEMV